MTKNRTEVADIDRSLYDFTYETSSESYCAPTPAR